MYWKIKKLSILLFFVLFFNQYLYCEYFYQRMQIAPLNRLTIYFSDIPKVYNSYLNSEKTIISLVIENVNSKLIMDSVISDGIIKKVELKKYSNHIEINIYLKSPRGYTVSPLEFSRALMVEVFDWNSLTQNEDNYRMGQLSLSHNLSVARNYFKFAFEENLANAGYFLGYLYLKSNLPENAKEIFLKAENLGCNIPDIFAALAQTYYLLNDKLSYEKYKSKYLAEQKLTSFNFIEIKPELKDSILKEPLEIFLTEKRQVEVDSTQVKDTSQTTKPIIIKEVPNENYKEKYSILEKIFIFLVASIIMVALILVTLYFKWKKEKNLLEIKKKFESELIKQKSAAIPNKIAAKIYKKTEEFTKPSVEEPTPNQAYINPDIKTLAEQIIDSKRAEKQQEANEEENPQQKQSRYPPRVEIAMQIQKEQAELFKKKIDKLETSSIPTNHEKLEELARNLGINKTSLLARKNIEAIEKNKDLYKDLFEKFFHKKND